MKIEQLSDGITVRNKKYDTVERVISANVLMKDSKRSWIPAVLYEGPDRLSLFQETRVFCKERKAFLNEFELVSVPDQVPDQGLGRCPKCGGVLGWANDFMLSDYYESPGMVMDPEDDVLVQNLTCTQCGCVIEVYEPTDEEKRNYPYWGIAHS